MVVLRSHHPQSQSSLRRELDKRAKIRTTQQHQHARFTTVFIPLLCRLCSISTVTNVNHLNEKNVFEVSISRNEWIKSWIETHFKPRSVSVVLVRSAQLNAHNPSHPIRLSDKKRARAMKRVCAIFVMVSSKQKRLIAVSVVFVSIAWPKKTTPSPPTWLSVDDLGLKMTCSNGCDNVKSTWEIKLHKSCVHFQCFAQLFCSESTNSIDWQSIEHKKVFQKQWKMCTNVVLFSLTAQTEFSECWIDFQCCSQCFCWTTS